MKKQEYTFWKLQPAETINKALSDLPEAALKAIITEDLPKDLAKFKPGEGPQTAWKGYRGIVVDKEGDKQCTAVVSDKYELVQHERAFRPVIEGLTLRGVKDFNYTLVANHKWAYMNVYIGKELGDGITYGFQVTNSFTGRDAIKWSFQASQATTWIEVVGYRQVCANGMKIRVPLDKAEFVKTEERTKITALLKKAGRIVHHTGTPLAEELEEMQYIVEAMMLLEKPLERIIKKAQNMKLTLKKARSFIEKYVARRMCDSILEAYGREEQTLWGLVNSVTFLASHKKELSTSSRNGLIDKSATLLEKAIQVKQ